MTFLVSDGRTASKGGSAPGAEIPRASPVEKPRRLRQLGRFSREHWILIALLAIMAGAFLFRLYYFWRHPVYTTDSYYFLTLARSLRSGMGYTVRGLAHFKYLPGYPLLITLFSYMFRDYARAAGYLAIIGGTLSIYFTYLLGRELMGEITGLLGAAILAFHPVFVQYTCFPMTEGIFTMLFVAGLYLLVSGCVGGSYYRRVGGAALGGLALITRWQGMLFFPLMVLIVILYWKEARFRKWEVPAMLALYLVPIGAFLIRNVVATGKLTAYAQEYAENRQINLRLMAERTVYLSWTTLFDKVVFYLGSLLALFRKFKAFLILFGWFALFVFFHIFWHYAHPRFMAPAIPATSLLAAYLFYEGWMLIRRFLKARRPGEGTPPIGEGRQRRRAPGYLIAVLKYAGYAAIIVVFTFTLYHNVVSATRVTTEQYREMADDIGGRGILDVVNWLKANAGEVEIVASNVGPYFAYEYDGPVLYVREVPAGVPFEEPDIEPPSLVKKMADRGVEYLLVSIIEGGPDTLDVPGVPDKIRHELAALGIEQKEIPRLRLVRVWQDYYDFPEPHYWYLALFEVLP